MQTKTASILDQLNESQREVVTTTDGPVLVLAGAGSGKTRALTARVAYLIEAGLAAPQEIVAMTFTNKAAQEMKMRVGRWLGSNTRAGAVLGTFHGLGARMLREQACFTSRSPSFGICDAQDSERLVRRAMDIAHVSKKEFSVPQLKAKISEAKQLNLTLEEAAARTSASIDPTVIVQVWRQYEAQLLAQDAWDFDDLIREPFRLLTREEVVRRAYQRRWRYLLVDEYQDTSLLQIGLLTQLTGPARNLCVVGDDYQAIYSWRGASVDTILQFEHQYPGCKTIYLTQNYRSTPEILKAAHEIIRQNAAQKHKRLWTQRESGKAVQVIAAPSDRAEALYVRTQLEEHVRGGGKLKECFVLYRTNAQSRVFEEEFLRAGLPYTIVGGFRFYERREIKDALALLTLTVQPNAQLALERVADALWRGVGPKTVQGWLAKSQAGQTHLLAVVIKESENRRILAPVAKAYTGLSAIQSTSVADTLRYLLKTSGYQAWLASQPDSEERQENIEELLNVTAAYSETEAFLQEVALLTDIDRVETAADRVMCLTLHAAKGLEAEVVFIAGLEDGLLPHRNSFEETAALEEERRLFYVGMTRAKSRLALLHAKQRYAHGELLPQISSRFLDELPVTVANIDLMEEELSYDAADEDWAATAGVGAFVSHPHFGRGVVVGNKGSLITCVFEGYGVKTISSESLSV